MYANLQQEQVSFSFWWRIFQKSFFLLQRGPKECQYFCYSIRIEFLSMVSNAQHLLLPSPFLLLPFWLLLCSVCFRLNPIFFQILDSVLFDTPKNSDSVHHNVFSVANVFALEYPKKLESYSDPSSGKILYRVGENNSKTLTDYKIEFFISGSLNWSKFFFDEIEKRIATCYSRV